MLVADVIERVRAISGYHSRGASISSNLVEVNDNKVLEAINNTQRQLAESQFRSFLTTASLSPEFLLASDQYLFENNYGWSSKATSNSIAKNILKVPVRELETRPAYFYDETNGSPSGRFIFDSDAFTYYPNEFSNLNGWLARIRKDTINPFLNYHFDAKTLNTFKISFNIYSGSRERILSKFDISLNHVPYVIKRVNQDLSIVVDYNNLKISIIHSGATQTSYIVEYLSYPYGRAGVSLLYNGKIRKLNAKSEGLKSRDIQMYVFPYSVVDRGQHLSEIITGSDIFEYFLYRCGYELSLSLRDVDKGLMDIVELKRREYMSLNRMKTINNHAFFPSL